MPEDEAGRTWWRDGVLHRRLDLGGDRAVIRRRTVVAALHLVREALARD